MNDPREEEIVPPTPVIDHVPEGVSEGVSEGHSVPPPVVDAPQRIALSERGGPAQMGGSDGPPTPPVLPPREPVPEPVPAKVVRRGGTPFLLTLVLTAGLGGGIYWTWTHPFASQPGQQADPQAAIDAAKSDVLAKLQALSDRLDKIEKQPAPADSGSAVADLAKKLDDLSSRLDAVSTRQDQLQAGLQKAQDIAAQKPAEPAAPPAPPAAPEASAAPTATGAGTGAEAQTQIADLGSKVDQAVTQEKASLDALAERLAKLEQNAQPPAQAADNKQALQTLDTRVNKLEQGEGQIVTAKQDATLAVKLAAAQVALAAGEPVGDVPGAPPALARFATVAPPTEERLRAAFPTVAAAALADSRPEETQDTFLSRALARLEQSVTVRQGDHVIVGDPAAGIVARAQQDLANDDIKAAADALGSLSGRAGAAVKDWVDQAHALVAARAALAALAAHG